MLHRAGQITLSQEVMPAPATSNTVAQHLSTAHKDAIELQINSDIKLYYDVHDSWEINKQKLEECDCYFKRSYAPSLLGHLGPASSKVSALGLNYLVYPSGTDVFAVQRARLRDSGGARIRSSLRALNPLNIVPFTPRLPLMEHPPNYHLPNKVLFISQTYDPGANRNRTKEKRDEIEQLNQSRARIIRTLRKAIGEDFCGGLIRTEYSEEHFGDVLVPANFNTSKRGYLNLLKSFPICVTSTGLHGSSGWKLAEYVAFSKSILTEKLNYEVPGLFSADQNYLVYDDPISLLEGVRRLQADKKLRQGIMQNNFDYYHSHVRPDKLMLNTIRYALSRLSNNP